MHVMSEGESGSKFTPKQKMAMYLTTIGVVGFVYLAPDIFRFVSGLPDAAWSALIFPFMVLAVGVVLVPLYAIWSVFSTAKTAIKKDTAREQAERTVEKEEKIES
jgi:hypothetical protein